MRQRHRLEEKAETPRTAWLNVSMPSEWLDERGMPTKLPYPYLASAMREFGWDYTSHPDVACMYSIIGPVTLDTNNLPNVHQWQVVIEPDHIRLLAMDSAGNTNASGIRIFLRPDEVELRQDSPSSSMSLARFRYMRHRNSEGATLVKVGERVWNASAVDPTMHPSTLIGVYSAVWTRLRDAYAVLGKVDADYRDTEPFSDLMNEDRPGPPTAHFDGMSSATRYARWRNSYYQRCLCTYKGTRVIAEHYDQLPYDPDIGLYHEAISMSLVTDMARRVQGDALRALTDRLKADLEPLERKACQLLREHYAAFNPSPFSTKPPTA